MGNIGKLYGAKGVRGTGKYSVDFGKRNKDLKDMRKSWLPENTG